MSYQTVSSLGITWAHGTTGASLMLLSHTDLSLQPTGVLLAKRIAPLTGELFGGGLRPQGVSYGYVSGTGPVQFSRALSYAQVDSRSRSGDSYDYGDQVSEQIHVCVQQFRQRENLSPLVDHKIIRLAVYVFRARQISEAQYQRDSADSVRSIVPIVEQTLETARAELDHMHSIVAVKTPEEKDPTGESLVRIMEETFGKETLARAKWQMTRLTKETYKMSFASQPLTIDRGWIEGCLCGSICCVSVQGFWNLLVCKHVSPTSFEASIPEIERNYQKTRNYLELINSIFHSAISAEKVPVCLSEEEVRQIPSFNRIPLIFASTQNLQSHVDPDSQIDFNTMSQQERALRGPLTLGKEINIVMTDPAHASDVKKFLLQHRIQGVSVFSITRKSVCEDPQLRPVSLEESATAAPEAAVPESGEVRGRKRQAESKLSVEPATKQPRSMSRNEEALSSLIAIHEMLLQDGQVAEAQKIAEQIAALV